jgi:uncharacterized protein YcbX
VEDNSIVGPVVSLYRYPVKSMQGEELSASAVTERGLLGDRAFALVREGKVASAKNPRRWPNLFDYRAAFVDPPRGEPLPPVRITLPDGTTLSSQQADCDQLLSAAFGRTLSLRGTAPAAPVLEEYWPDLDGLPHRDAVTDEAMPPGTFFDCAVVHLLTTATLDRLRALYPQGRFEVRRFRPNIVVACAEEGFVEQGWVGRTLALGRQVRLRITGPCGRCVMTTLAQADLPRDLGILHTAVQHAGGNVGVYASVVRGGTVQRGDVVQLEEAPNSATT